jgi:hypothetical protein
MHIELDSRTGFTDTQPLQTLQNVNLQPDDAFPRPVAET